MTSDGSFDVSNIKRSIGLLHIPDNSTRDRQRHKLSFMSYTQITDTHDNISKGEKIILSRWIFNICTFSCTVPVKSKSRCYTKRRMGAATHILLLVWQRLWTLGTFLHDAIQIWQTSARKRLNQAHNSQQSRLDSNFLLESSADGKSQLLGNITMIFFLIMHWEKVEAKRLHPGVVVVT